MKCKVCNKKKCWVMEDELKEIKELKKENKPINKNKYICVYGW